MSLTPLPKDRRGAPRRGKAHCEAFPSLDLLAACRVGPEDVGCEWLDETGRSVGAARFLISEAAHAVVAYSFPGSANVDPGTGHLSLRLLRKRVNPHVVRTSMECPVCASSRQIIYYVKSAWACSICHDLVHLSQRTGDVNKKILRRDKL